MKLKKLSIALLLAAGVIGLASCAGKQNKTTAKDEPTNSRHRLDDGASSRNHLYGDSYVCLSRYAHPENGLRVFVVTDCSNGLHLLFCEELVYCLQLRRRPAAFVCKFVLLRHYLYQKYHNLQNKKLLLYFQKFYHNI